MSTTAGAAIGAGLVGRGAWGQKADAKPGPNETVNVGLIGCGSRGPYLSYVFQLTPGVRLAGLCDVHAGHLATAMKQASATGATQTRELKYF